MCRNNRFESFESGRGIDGIGELAGQRRASAQLIVRKAPDMREFDSDILSDAIKTPVLPNLQTLARLRIWAWNVPNLVGRSPCDVNSPAVSSPAAQVCRKMIVRVGDSPVVLLLKRILLVDRNGVSSLPELLDELVALLIVRELKKRFTLNACD